MAMVVWAVLLVCVLCAGGVAAASRAHGASSAAEKPLSYYAPKQDPWIDLHAGSNQLYPIYIGTTPWDLVHDRKAAKPTIWDKSKGVGEAQLNVVVNCMIQQSVITGRQSTLYFEVWPAFDDYTGQQTWAFARWKSSLGAPWQFLDITLPEPNFNTTSTIVIATPQTLRPWNETENGIIFNDFTQFDNLYVKPAFGNCIFSQEDVNRFTGGFITEGWPDPSNSNRNKKRIEITQYDKQTPSPNRIVCRAIPQPARFNHDAITFTISVAVQPVNSSYVSTEVTWPDGIAWVPLDSTLPPTPSHLTPRITSWPPDFLGSWKQDILWLDGEQPVQLPNGTTVRFSHKNAADPHTRLDQVFDWLRGRYASMGINTAHAMQWIFRNISEMNLIVVLPGTDRSLPPVLVADHVDTAYCEDIFDQTGQRVSNPGADDNGSATATLIKTAEILGSGKYPHKRDIWLVHLTGEEYPPDDMGVRHVVMALLKTKTPIKGMVLMDMISWRRNSSDTIFQINAGNSAPSRELAKCAYEVSTYINNYTETPITAAFRWRFDDFSYLYNTDGVVLSDMGFPIILINEHINGYQNFDRPYYHTSHDLVKTLDLEYGTAVAKVAIETVAHLANS